MTQPASLLRRPIGRRVAYWRQRRGMNQQALADLVGKSLSWVDKVERGQRGLDKFSVVREIADALEVDPLLLLGVDTSGNGEGRRWATNHALLFLLREALVVVDGVLRSEHVDARIRRRVAAAVVSQYRQGNTKVRQTRGAS